LQEAKHGFGFLLEGVAGAARRVLACDELCERQCDRRMNRRSDKRCDNQSGNISTFSSPDMRLCLRFAIPFAIAITIACATRAAAGPEFAGALAEGAQQAQARCYRLVHDDTNEFGTCVRELAQQQRSAAKRLGIDYFGWVGAMNSARMGMRGADETAAEFLARFRAAQNALGVDDATLCASVPGDCKARIARIRQAERKPSN
jgi:hypothetical protein